MRPNKQVRNSLELKINIKSLKLTQRKLRVANEKLKGYAHIVSHDLKTPIANIRMLTRVLENEHLAESSAEQKDIVGLINESASSLLTFIDGILKRCKTLNMGGNQYKTIDAHQLVQKIVRMIAPQHDIKIHINNKLPKVKTDQLLLQQIFQNLITNAIKYNDKIYPDQFIHQQFFSLLYSNR